MVGKKKILNSGKENTVEDYGPVIHTLSGEWRIMKNVELEPLFYKPNILETIKSKRL